MDKEKDKNLIFDIIQPDEPVANLLMVDDNEIALKFRSRLFASAGFNVDVATDGYEALEKIKTNGDKYDVVFMNFIMPICDGIQATKLIKSRTNFDKPIIGFSAGMFGYKQYYDAGIKAGMVDCVDSRDSEMLNALLDVLYNKKPKIEEKKKTQGFFSKLKSLIFKYE